MKSLNDMANNVASEIRQLQAQSSLPYIEARLHTTYELDEQAHKAHLSLYTHEYDGNHDSIFRGDAPDGKVELAISSYRGENKQFIAALTDALSPDFCYLSEQVHLDIDREGASDVSDRFAFKDLLAALATIAAAPVVVIPKASALHANSLAVREKQLEALLHAHYTGLSDEDDTTIYFVCDIVEDESSQEDGVYVYSEHRVCDADINLIGHIDEDVFDACAPDNPVGDIETQMHKVEVDEWLTARGVAIQMPAAEAPSKLP